MTHDVIIMFFLCWEKYKKIREASELPQYTLNQLPLEQFLKAIIWAYFQDHMTALYKNRHYLSVPALT